MADSGKKLSYEAARDELAEIVESLEDGSASLEESLKLWERGEELAKICQEWLDGAKKKIDAAKVANKKSASGGDQ
jgi:exodeoxyribonuclease VII small subunit